jgi:hypothetical protein
LLEIDIIEGDLVSHFKGYKTDGLCARFAFKYIGIINGILEREKSRTANLEYMNLIIFQVDRIRRYFNLFAEHD